MLEHLKRAMKEYKTILEPEKNEKDWWAGAPSVVLTTEGRFLLAARMREADSPRGRRGYEIRILESNDGESFSTIKKIHRDDANVSVFERPSLVQNPLTKKFLLFGCSALKSGWGIWKMDEVEDPDQIDPSTLTPVLESKKDSDNVVPSGLTNLDANHHQYVKINGYKDPFIFWEKINGGIDIVWHMFVIGYDKVERPYHFVSKTSRGENWELVSKQPILESSGWHNFFTRPACLLPLAVGYLFVYEGSNIRDFDPVYNISSGLSYTPDLKTYYDLTPKKPLFQSATPCDYNTWRYSHWLRVKEEIYVYYESCRPNQSNEIRLSKFPIHQLA